MKKYMFLGIIGLLFTPSLSFAFLTTNSQVDPRKKEIPLLKFDGRCLMYEEGEIKNRNLEVNCEQYSQVFVTLVSGREQEVKQSTIKNACTFSNYKSAYIVESGETRESIIKKFDLIDSEVPKDVRINDVLAVCPHSGEKHRAQKEEEERIQKQIDDTLDARLEDDKTVAEQEFQDRVEKEVENRISQLQNNTVITQENTIILAPPIKETMIVDQKNDFTDDEKYNNQEKQENSINLNSVEEKKEVQVEKKQNFPTKIFMGFKNFLFSLFSF